MARKRGAPVSLSASAYPAYPTLEHALANTRRAFEDFIHIIAYDLGAPLRHIVNFSRLIEDRYGPALDDNELRYVDLIHESSRKAQQRISGLMLYSRLDTVPMSFAPVDAARAVEHSLQQLKHDVEDANASIRIAALPHLIADEDRLSLLFYCLLSNALKFSNASPQVEVGAQRCGEGWRFWVRDNGIGIEKKDQEAIFSVFHRLHSDADYPGIGMGLALARRIVALHGGRMGVESTPGAGTAFFFILPDRPIPIPPAQYPA